MSPAEHLAELTDVDLTAPLLAAGQRSRIRTAFPEQPDFRKCGLTQLDGLISRHPPDHQQSLDDVLEGRLVGPEVEILEDEADALSRGS